MTLLYENKDRNEDNYVFVTTQDELSSKGYRFDGLDNLYFTSIDLGNDGLGVDIVVSEKEVYARLYRNDGDTEYTKVADDRDEAVKIANSLARDIRGASSFADAYEIIYNHGLED